MPFVRKVRRQPNNPLIRSNRPTANERRVLQTYLDAFKNVRGSTINRETFALIMEQVAAGNPLSAASLIPWGNFAQDLQPFVDVTTAQVVTSANQSLARLPKRLQVDYTFDLTDPRAIAWAQTRAGASIAGISEESRQAVARIIADGLRSKLDMEQMAARIETIVGLDQRQAKSLDRFYGETLEQLMDEGASFNEATQEVRERAKPLYDRMIRYRGLRIARTEMVTAANQGRVLSWFEIDSQGLMPPDSQRIWITALDERTCSVCAPKHRQTVAWDSDFDFGSPALHPHCRCSIELLPGKPSARIAAA
jgi:hypothetical protein